MNENSLAAYFEQYNQLNKREKVIYNYVANNPGLSGEEIIKGMKFSKDNQVLPRLTDLKNKGLIQVSGTKLNKFNRRVSIYKTNPIINIKPKKSKVDKLIEMASKLDQEEREEFKIRFWRIKSGIE